MVMDPIQFQPGMDLSGWFEQYGTEQRQTSVRSGTVFHSLKLPLCNWFQASQSKNNISALALKRQLG